ncbi:MAG: pyruvate kinase [Bacteroidia bacterium]
MKNKKNKLKEISAELDALCTQALHFEQQFKDKLATLHPQYRASAANLIHYLALRQRDIRDLQNRLGQLGASRLGRAESHVMASLQAIRRIVHLLQDAKDAPDERAALSMKEGRKALKRHTRALLGHKIKGSHIRIMVTLPSEAAGDYAMVRQLVEAGMSVARINCAHDDAEAWLRMIRHVRRVTRETGRLCRVSMDLGGPKLRTGAMQPGPEVIHLRPSRNQVGQVIQPAVALLVPLGKPLPESELPAVPVPVDWLEGLRVGDLLRLRDTRDKLCYLEIVEKGTRCLVSTKDSVYITPGAQLHVDNRTYAAGAGTVGPLPPVEEFILLEAGDVLLLTRDPRPGENARYDETGRLLAPAHISCTLPEVFGDVKVGDPVRMNDGKIEGIVQQVSKDTLEVRITFPREGDAKLRGDKGINFPESKLSVRGLTDKDREDLQFIVEHADIVNFSFVNRPRDVEDLLEELRRLKAEDLGIILKIETRSGYTNLPGILLSAMSNYPIGVMLARGDLAIEAGWEHLAYVQEEILRICEAAHVPIVWATQVLETHAKKGLPSRAEITDAAKAHNAECVMLNKGPHIVQTIHLLNEILESMEDYRQKTAPMLPGLKVRIPEAGALPGDPAA